MDTLGNTPRNDDELHGWLLSELGLTVPRRAALDGHRAPFAYLSHSFFRPEGVPPDSVVWANRGGGKTFLGAVATALDVVFKPGIEVRVLAGSLEQAGRMHAHLRAIFERERLAPLIDGRMTDKRLRLTNGSGVELLAASQASVRGTRVQVLRCDEVDLFSPAIWEAAQLVTRSKVCGGVPVRGAVECLSTMHKPFGMMAELVRQTEEGRRELFKWGVVDVLDRCDEERSCHRCALWPECGGRAKQTPETELGHISIDDALTMKRRVALPVWESEMLCLRPRRTDAVYPEFDIDRHVVDRIEPEPTWRWVCGMDFGYRAPTVILFGCVDERGVLHIVDERSRREVVVAEHGRSIIDSPWPEPAWVGVDPAGHQRSGQTGATDIAVLKSLGLRIKSRRSLIRHGVQLVTQRLAPASGEPTLFIHRRCQTLIDALERYHYPEDRPESTDPVKDGPDHAADALRYLIVNLDEPYTATRSKYTGG
ncbi:MAG: hypothetical protein AAFR96_03800 [Planctomycetota bacterium]